jgi:hypothetical protein
MLDRWRSGRVRVSVAGEEAGDAACRSVVSRDALAAAPSLPLENALVSRRLRPYLLTVENALVSRREPRPPPRNRRAFMVLAYRQEYRCAGCRELLHPDSQADHVVPWSLSGDDADGNVQILCPNCHAAKSAEELPRIRRAREILMRLQADRRGELEGLCWGCMGVRSVFFAGEACQGCVSRAGRPSGFAE